MTEKEKLLVFMSMYEVSNKKQETLSDFFDDSKAVDDMVFGKEFEEVLSAEEVKKLRAGFDLQALNSSVENIQRSGIKILTIFSEEYPQKLIDLPDRPLILYCKGNLNLLKMRGIAMVGTRMPTNYGKIITEKFAKTIAENNFVVVSGLCYGVDTISHKATLSVGGKTIAVVGSGFNNIYPATNNALADEIAEKGLLMSEYPPSFQAKKYTFPRRNRIIAGLSDGVLITEAGLKSGTVHTKEYALEYGRDLFAVPGNINSGKSELTNHMIKTAQAECVTSPEDILNYYGVEKQAKANKYISLNMEEQMIVNLLDDGEKDFDFLSQKTKIPTNILSSCLTTLEIRGLIKKLPAQTYALS